MCHSLFPLSPPDGHPVVSSCVQHHYQHSCTRLLVGMFSLLLDKHFGEDLLGYPVATCLTFYESGTFPKVVVAFGIPTSRVGGSRWLLVLVNIWRSQSVLFTHPSGCEVVCLCVLIYISLMTNDVEHFVMCSLAIYKSSSVRCLYKYFAHLFNPSFGL